MALQYISTGDGRAAIGTDSATGERGFLVKVVNRTGKTSVKGEVVSASTTANMEVILQNNEFDAFGVIQEAGVAEGSEMFIWVNGSICKVLFEDGIAPTRGSIAICSDVDGRADNVANPGTGLPGVEVHFKEIGHVMETVTAGTNILALVMTHYN
jgi:hypothetical protein